MAFALMKLPASALLFLSFAFALQAQAPSTRPKPEPSKRDECSIAGMVVKLAGSEPIKNATVQLLSTEDHAKSTSITTDVGGRFLLKGIFPGRYRLNISKNGFVDQEYGQRKPGDPGSILTLHPGQDMRDLVFRMIPSAVISGRILNEDGEPFPFVAVSALREIYANGKRKLSSEAEFQTNDLGEYRLFGLPPGRYFVSAIHRGRSRGFQVPQARPTTEGPEMGYGRLYYPGTPDAAKATALTVRAGDEISSVEILLRRFPVYRVSGRIFNLVPRRSGRAVNLTLVRRASNWEWEPDDQAVDVVGTPEDTFEIHDVLPGSYNLMAYLFEDDARYVSRTNIEVTNSDLEGVTVVVSPGMNISGRLVWDGPPCTIEGELRVTPWPVDPGGAFIRSVKVQAPGATFALTNVSEGTYRPRVSGLSKDCFTKDVQYGGVSSLEEGFTVARSTSSLLEITLSSRGAHLQGSVVDADNLPAAGVWVVLVPDAKHRSRYELFRSQATDQYGHFDFRGLPPGEYKLFSWEEVETNAWQDPDFLQPFEDKGERVELKESDQKSVSLVAIRRAAAGDNQH